MEIHGSTEVVVTKDEIEKTDTQEEDGVRAHT